MTAQADFLADPKRQEIWLAELYPYDSGSGSTVTLYYSTGEYGTLPTESPASQGYRAQLVQAWNVALDAQAPGTVGVLPDVRGGELRLGSRFGDLDTLANYDWDGRRVVIKLTGTYNGGQRLAHADALVVFDGQADQLLVGLDECILRLRDPETSWGDPIESRRFSGSSWMLDFGSGDVITLGTPAKLNVTGDLTIQARLRLSSVSAQNKVISWRNTATTYPFLLATAATTPTLVYRNSALAGAVTSSGSLPIDTWCTVALTVTGSSLRFYAWREDTGASVLVESFTLSSSTHPSGDGNLRIGEDNSATSPGMQLDWLRAWNVVKTQDELDDLRMRQLSDAEEADASCLASYRAETGSGTTLTDSSGTPANGTISGCDWRPSLEGGADLEGKTKPNVFGAVEGASPVLVYPATQIYAVHAANVSAIDAVREGGNSITLGTAYTNLLTFLAATTTAGKFDSLITAGGSYIRLGTNPSKPITVDVRGDASGSGYVSTAGALVRRIVTTRGLSPLTDPTDLDTTSFSDLDTANSAVCGHFVACDETATIRDVVDALLGSVGAVAYFARGTRKLTVKRFEAVSGSSSVTLDENDIPKLEPVSVELPVWKVTVRYRRNWTTLSSDQLAGAIVGTSGEQFYREEWRSVTRSNPAVKTRHARAREITIDSDLTTLAAATAEAVRLLALYGTEHRSLRVVASSSAAQLDRFGLVTVKYSDLTVKGATQTRLGLGSSGLLFRVLGIAGSQADGTETLTVWR